MRYIDPDGRACDSLSGGGCGMTVTGQMSSDPQAARAALDFVADFTPIGDAIAISEAIAQPTLVNVSAAIVGLLPFVGDAAAKIIKSTKPETTVIGRTKDLQNLNTGERSLLDRLPDQGSPRENWRQNSEALRQEMRNGQPIRDASPGDTAGQYLNAERNLLEDRGWTFDPVTNYWNPPAQ